LASFVVDPSVPERNRFVVIHVKDLHPPRLSWSRINLAACSTRWRADDFVE
jgi:hypothetical protein